MKYWFTRIAVRLLRPVVAEMLREESTDLVQWAILLEKSHEKVFHFRIERNSTLRERVHLLGARPARWPLRAAFAGV